MTHKLYLSDMNEPLATQYIPNGENKPYLTVEDSKKWRKAFVIKPNGTVEPFDFDEFEDASMYGPDVIDNAINPSAFHNIAERWDLKYDSKTFSRICERWVEDYLDDDWERLHLYLPQKPEDGIISVKFKVVDNDMYILNNPYQEGVIPIEVDPSIILQTSEEIPYKGKINLNGRIESIREDLVASRNKQFLYVRETEHTQSNIRKDYDYEFCKLLISPENSDSDTEIAFEILDEIEFDRTKFTESLRDRLEERALRFGVNIDKYVKKESLLDTETSDLKRDPNSFGGNGRDEEDKEFVSTKRYPWLTDGVMPGDRFKIKHYSHTYNVYELENLSRNTETFYASNESLSDIIKTRK